MSEKSKDLSAEINFDGIYISGAVMANDLGVPDIGITTLKEVSYRANQIAKVTDLPSIVDADTGFGDCKRTISTFKMSYVFIVSFVRSYSFHICWFTNYTSREINISFF